MLSLASTTLKNSDLPEPKIVDISQSRGNCVNADHSCKVPHLIESYVKGANSPRRMVFFERNQITNLVSDKNARRLKITPVLLDRSVRISTFAWRSRIIVNNKFAVKGVAFPPMLTMPRGVLMHTAMLVTLVRSVGGGEGGQFAVALPSSSSTWHILSRAFCSPPTQIAYPCDDAQQELLCDVCGLGKMVQVFSQIVHLLPKLKDLVVGCCPRPQRGLEGAREGTMLGNEAVQISKFGSNVPREQSGVALVLPVGQHHGSLEQVKCRAVRVNWRPPVCPSAKVAYVILPVEFHLETTLVI